MMKDMSLEELIDESFDLVILDEHPEYKAELLRRFDELGKCLTDIGVERDNALVAYESLKCCGNCNLFNAEDCKRKPRPFEHHQPNESCPHWTTDGLTREERGK